jgi:hypothetical protein
VSRAAGRPGPPEAPHRARKRFGQHFLEPAWVEKVIAAFETDAPTLGREGSIPIRPNSTEVAVQRNPGRIIIRDWTSVGAEPFATVTPQQMSGTGTTTQQWGPSGAIDLKREVK